MSFNVALTGVTAANTDLNVVANNLANAQTIGFKGGRAEFADLYATTQQGIAAVAPGNGVKVTEIAQQFSQGDIDNTGNSLDLAISGNGFFVVSQNGATEYTRNGEFQTDSANNVVTASGQNLQVYPPNLTNGLPNGSFNTGSLTNLVLNPSESAPQTTTSASLTANLSADATTPIDAGSFDPSDPNSYNNATSLTVYDSLGAAHTATLYFTSQAPTTPGAWSTNLYIDGNAVGSAQTLQYDSYGNLTSPTNGQVDFGAYQPATGAAPIDVNFDLSNTTQYGGNFGVTAINQNGYTTGLLTGISIDNTGIVQAQYTNGKSIVLGQVAVANFANPQGLENLGNTSWSETNASGEPVMGVAGNSSFGKIQSGSLELANVDTTTELVNMITAQRAFQANAQMIQTNDQITQTIIGIRN